MRFDHNVVGRLEVLGVTVLVTASATWAVGAPEAVKATVLENTPQRIVIKYEIGDWVAEPVVIKGREYITPRLGKEGLMLVKGAPDLPHVCRSLIIPNDAEMAVRLLDSRHYDVSGVLVAPSKGNLLRTQDPARVPWEFGEVYHEDTFWPGELAAGGEPYIQRDFRGMVVTVNPLQYNPVAETLRVYTEITVEVVPVGPSTANVLAPGARTRSISQAFHQIYKHHFLNYAPDLRYTPLDETGEMLIICYDAWLPNAQPLVDHKNAIGITTTAVGISTMGNNSTAIKNYIQNRYNTSDLAFVLLVGDAGQIATPTAQGGSADPTYALLAGSDHYPDVLVGRFSAEASAQVDTQVLRTIEYELLPATQQAWFKRGTGIASNQGPGDDGEYDNQHMDHIRLDLLGYGYTVVDQIYDPGATAGLVSAALNAGRGIVNYCGHGSVTAWSTSGFSNSNVAALQNDNMLPFIFSVACVNGQFNGTTCFAEAWLRSTRSGEPIGAIATYMSSINQSWSPPMAAQDESVDMLVAEAYFSFGALCFAGSCKMMDEYGTGGQAMFDTWHVFGDPSVRVFGTAQPPHGLKVTPPDGIVAGGPIGGPFNPTSTIYTLENQNDTGLDYSVATLGNWLAAEPAGGHLEGHATVTVTVSFSPAAVVLPRGLYAGTVNFINVTDHDGDTARDVSLRVGGPAWDPVAFNVAVSTGVSLATDIILSASDPNGDPLTYVIESLPASGFLRDPVAGPIETVPYTLVGGGKVVNYQPPCGQTLQDSFTFSVRDLSADSNIATVSVTVSAGASRRVYYFPLDSDPGWTTEGLWAFGQPAGAGTHNLDPDAGYTGLNVYGYNLNGDYSNNMSIPRYLTTAALDCSELTSTEIRFQRWLGVESYDRASLLVSNDGVNWTAVWQNPTGSSTADWWWSPQSYNVSATADGASTVYFRWSLGPTDNSVTYPGWNLDDIEIWAVVPVVPSDFDGNGLVTLEDFGVFSGCFSGPGGGTAPGCLCIDLDGDGDVDLTDFAVFQAAFAVP